MISVDFHNSYRANSTKATANLFPGGNAFATLRIESGDDSVTLFLAAHQIEAARMAADVLNDLFSPKPAEDIDPAAEALAAVYSEA